MLYLPAVPPGTEQSGVPLALYNAGHDFLVHLTTLGNLNVSIQVMFQRFKDRAEATSEHRRVVIVERHQYAAQRHAPRPGVGEDVKFCN